MHYGAHKWKTKTGSNKNEKKEPEISKTIPKLMK
jgi:hypothetical protein